ncbi:MAG: ankyrin repeat domain-containing protein [Legionella sp.]|nr:ankyrin repeat domain-containing protein [Legionella sp.]
MNNIGIFSPGDVSTMPPFNIKNSLTLDQLPPLLSNDEYVRLKAQAKRSAEAERDNSVVIAQELLDQQAADQHKIKITDQMTPKDILALSQTLEGLFSVANPKSFQVSNYLEHANKIVLILSQLTRALNGCNWNSSAIKNKLNKELNNIYEVLADHGWHCDNSARGLMPASAEGLARFLGGLIGEKTQSKFENPLESAKAIQQICFHGLKAHIPMRSSQAQQRTGDESNVAAEQNDLNQLIEKIKNSELLDQEPLILGNPFVANQISKYESKLEDLGFTTPFYAAKYATNKGSIACLLQHCTNSKMKLDTLSALLKNPNNPYFGARVLMISAQFGTSLSLSEILNSITDAEKTNHVNYAISRKGTYEGWTALHFACSAEFATPNKLEAQLEKITTLLKHKADINAPTKANPSQTPLSIALSTSNYALCNFLIQHGACLNIEANYLISLIKKSTFSHEEKQEICRIFDISFKACQLNRPTQSGLSPRLAPETPKKRTADAPVSLDCIPEDSAPNIQAPAVRMGLFYYEENKDRGRRALSTVQNNLKNLGFELGTAYSQGDCFFDSFAQGIERLQKPTSIDLSTHNLKNIRQRCQQEALKLKNQSNSWLASALQAEHEEIDKYSRNITYSAKDIELRVASELETPIWGRGHIEGRLLCAAFNVSLHLIELVIDADERITVLHSFIDANGYKRLPEQTSQLFNQPNTVHMAVYQNTLHFVPILPPANHALAPAANQSPIQVEEPSAKRARGGEAPSIASSSSALPSAQPASVQSVSMQDLAERQQEQKLMMHQRDLMLRQQERAFFLHTQYTAQNLAAAQQSMIEHNRVVNELYARLDAEKQKRPLIAQTLANASIQHASSLNRSQQPQLHYIHNKNETGLMDVSAPCNCLRPDCLNGLFNSAQRATAAPAANRNSFFNMQPTQAIVLEAPNTGMNPAQ